MIHMKLAEAFAFSAPVVCAVICMIMMLMDAHARRSNPVERRLRLFLAFAYLVSLLGWLGMVFFVLSPRVFVYYYTVFLLTLMLDQVMIYRFVSIITNTGEHPKFNRLHLIIPLLIIAVSATGSLLVPVDRQMDIIYGDAGYNSWFRVMYVTATVIFVVYNSLYPALNLRNIRRYREFIVNYSADAYYTSLNWQTIIQVLILVTVPLPFAGLLIGVPVAAVSSLLLFGALAYFINYLILCFNLLNSNYLIIQPDALKNDSPSMAASIDRKHFERYLRDKSPYLNPQLRITGLAAGLNTNRSYISEFISKEYQMNFCSLINRCRLNELDHLRLLPSNATKSNMDLVLMAGFSSYRSYLRAKKEEDKLALLKVFEK
ncbi:AraC family transcriptional regulator [Bacteroides uniformis]|jgi:AraC-like DNA-binding protein|uniref:AraC family transcriptional regulator n=1 Tax=Bacteroides uniformis TaxID=820 RepID=UPI00319DDFED